jgi:hypothetical protein
MLAKSLLVAKSKRKVQLLKQVRSPCLFQFVFLKIASCTGENQLGTLEMLNVIRKEDDLFVGVICM